MEMWRASGSCGKWRKGKEVKRLCGRMGLSKDCQPLLLLVFARVCALEKSVVVDSACLPLALGFCSPKK